MELTPTQQLYVRSYARLAYETYTLTLAGDRREWASWDEQCLEEQAAWIAVVCALAGVYEGLPAGG